VRGKAGFGASFQLASSGVWIKAS